jgi:capsule biosynthesis phosphatase
MRIAIDLDGTICNLKKPGQSYGEVLPNRLAVERLRQLRSAGHQIIILTARHMKTCDGNVSDVVARVGKITLDWLARHEIPYDEIHFGKPYADVYLDDLGERFAGWESLTPEYLDHSTVNILIPMAGAGSRFTKAGFTDPKPLIKAKGEPLIKWAMKSFVFFGEVP